jgi:hypothetical protein
MTSELCTDDMRIVCAFALCVPFFGLFVTEDTSELCFSSALSIHSITNKEQFPAPPIAAPKPRQQKTTKVNLGKDTQPVRQVLSFVFVRSMGVSCVVLCCGVLSCVVVLCCAVLCCVMLCCVLLCCDVLCCVVLCCVVLCCVVLCCAV